MEDEKECEKCANFVPKEKVRFEIENAGEDYERVIVRFQNGTRKTTWEVAVWRDGKLMVWADNKFVPCLGLDDKGISNDPR